jgi:hypothetical protein
MSTLIWASTASAGEVPTTGALSLIRVGETNAMIEIPVTPNGLATVLDVELAEQQEIEAHGWGVAIDSPLNGIDVGAASEELHITRTVDALESNVAYELRVTVKNELGSEVSAPIVFRTLPPSGASASGLPDGRAYELVSAGAGRGEPYGPPSGARGEDETLTVLPFQASETGESVAYPGEPAGVEGDGETGPGLGNEWLARRGPAGWLTEDITPKGAEQSVYEAFTFSEGRSSGYVEAGREALTSGPFNQCRRLYAASSGTEHSPTEYYPLFTPPASATSCNPLFAGASAGDGTVIFQSEGALTPNAQEADELPSRHENREEHRGGDEPSAYTCMFACNLYVAEAGKIALVNELGGKDVPNANFGGYPLPPYGGFGDTDFSNAISRDGSRIYWTDTQEGVNEDRVFMYSGGKNTAVSEGPAQYWTATSDGHYAYYVENGALMQFDADSDASAPLTASSAGVLGVLGVNETGELGEVGEEDRGYLYFVASGVLANNTNAQGASASEGEANLYLIHDGATTYLATLAAQDNNLEADTEARVPTGGDWRADLGERTSEVSPSGESLMFVSVNPLTGYDNTSESGSPAPEAFVYSAANAQLVCASCSPDGARPAAQELVSSVPISAEGTTYTHRWMSNNGNRVFFDSEQALVPQVTGSGTWNVYEWEREGEGSCRAAIPARALEGCVYVLSGGYQSTNAFLVEADANGNNVFFVHRGGLGEAVAPGGRNELYDARVGGGFPTAIGGCAGVGCASPPAPAGERAALASTPFEGMNDNYKPTPAKLETRADKLKRALARCQRLRKRLRKQCSRAAEKRYGPRVALGRGSKKKKGSHS